ncbi:flagellar motor protein [Desulfosporosinus acidiphilus SJ4]|uniref:Flagellar motor protein n=1 Tax=Desulfosporosinus acidiphilus (strain DSM 22704 / JCM 16185 / SJ4) TaxID=646529 RepID=I4DAB9_DESAJ|nr:flagellar motor protein MotB [Desulfosporosinus acidiphilus]AFM42743.1 flagellar motor protein [Desulfosporosinus acidiphilus SJ4]
MSRKRQHEAEKENGERWLLTYSDLITLLMIFFVVLYSMSQVDAQKFQAVAAALNSALSGGSSSRIQVSTNPSGPNIVAPKTPQIDATKPSNSTTKNNQKTGQGNTDADNLNIEAIKAKLDKFASDNNIQSTLVTSIEERGLVIRIQETLLFESGSADITPYARNILEKISTVLAAAPNQIRVEGHTDNLPINTAKFPSNWELSVIRATNVVQILQNDGVSPERLSATGYGEYRPIASNDTEAGRSRNRRIDLIILRSKYDVTEPSAGASSTSANSAPVTGNP